MEEMSWLSGCRLSIPLVSGVLCSTGFPEAAVPVVSFSPSLLLSPFPGVSFRASSCNSRAVAASASARAPVAVPTWRLAEGAAVGDEDRPPPISLVSSPPRTVGRGGTSPGGPLGLSCSSCRSRWPDLDVVVVSYLLMFFRIAQASGLCITIIAIRVSMCKGK